MKERLPIILAATALALALLAMTPAGQSASSKKRVPKGVSFAKTAGYAAKAGFAKNAGLLGGSPAAAFQRRVAGTCKVGSAIRLVGADGGVGCEPLWGLTGNAGTSPSTNFLGTTDAQPLVLKTNNAEALRVTADGNVGIGTQTPGARLEVRGSGQLGGVLARLGSAQPQCNANFVGLVGCTDTPGGAGVSGTNPTGSGVTGSSSSGKGVVGISHSGPGVLGDSSSAQGVWGESGSGTAVQGFSITGIGLYGDSTTRGVVGTLGQSSCAGVYAIGGCTGTTIGYALWGRNATGSAVVGSSDSGNVFLGVTTTNETHVARIDSTGKGFFNGGTQTGGADYAESIPARGGTGLAPGDVLALDPAHPGYAVAKSEAPNSQLVVGVYSTRPAVLAVGSYGVDSRLVGEVPVAMVGVVPTKLSAENGPIRAGDLLTTARTPGYAMKARAVVVGGIRIYRTGTILGKALQPLASGKATLKVLLMLR